MSRARDGRQAPVAAGAVDSLIGIRLTVVLGRLLVLDDVALSGADAEAVWVAVRATTDDLRPGVHRVRVRQGLYMAVRGYLSTHLPGPDWEFVGAEVAAGGVRADLVWRSVDHAGILVDEVKLIVPAGPLEATLLRQLASVARAYIRGDCYVIVRLLSIAHPQRSRTFAAADLASAGGLPAALPGALA